MNNFKLLHELSEEHYLKGDFKSFILDEKILENNIKDDMPQNKQYSKNSCTHVTQFISFQKCMAVLVKCGQYLGLHPVLAILDRDISEVRFTVYSWRFLYTALIVTGQTIAAIFSLYKLLGISKSIQTLAYISFVISTWCGLLILVRIATKWEKIVTEIFYCKLDKYVDPHITFRCNATCATFFAVSLSEHILSITVHIIRSVDCAANGDNSYEIYLKNTFPWVNDIDKPHVLFVGTFLQINNTLMAAIWSYVDIFIICISLFLASVLNQINKKILWASDQTYLPPSIWGSLREDYSRGTRLVRQFDNMLSGLVLVSFALNIFFICLQILNVVANGLEPRPYNSGGCLCYPIAPLYGYEYSVYLMFSTTYLIIKFLVLSNVAASVNVASLVPTLALYNVPSCSYSVEVQRFLDQLHDDIVALSGMKYFYITKDLIVSVIGTIVTYELVLLQFSSEEINIP